MKRCYYMCVRLCGVYVRGVLFPQITFQNIKNFSENQLVDKQAISNNLKNLSDKLASETNRVLSENFSLVEKLALALLEKETMTAEEVYAILA